ncbi:MAG: GNAT family N-acetyltransferase [Planctomycetes bacterium]|nr:GNAT family N-acetyltransferase [Planctomycetota bacterium]
MSLAFRPAAADDFAQLERLVIGSFEPITWIKKLDAKVGPLNGCDWRARWQARLRHVFETEVILLGETEGAICAMSSATIEREPALAFIDLLAVDREFQGRGFGRAMLRAMIEHVKGLGCQYVHLDCLTDNDAGNELYRSEGFEEVARHIRWFRKI